MHRLTETTFRESLASKRRCFWLSRTDAIKPVTTTLIPHHLPKFSSTPAWGSSLDLNLNQTCSSQDWSCPGPGQWPWVHSQGLSRAVLDTTTCSLTF